MLGIVIRAENIVKDKTESGREKGHFGQHLNISYLYILYIFKLLY